MKTQLLSEDFVRMQRLAGILNESQYYAALNEFSIPGLSKVKDFANKIEATPEFKKLMNLIASKLTKNDVQKLKTEFPVKEAGNDSLDFEDIFKKVSAQVPAITKLGNETFADSEKIKEDRYNQYKDVPQLEAEFGIAEKIINVVRKIANINLASMGIPLAAVITVALSLNPFGFGMAVAFLISIIASCIIRWIANKILYPGIDMSNEPLV